MKDHLARGGTKWTTCRPPRPRLETSILDMRSTVLPAAPSVRRTGIVRCTPSDCPNMAWFPEVPKWKQKRRQLWNKTKKIVPPYRKQSLIPQKLYQLQVGPQCAKIEIGLCLKYSHNYSQNYISIPAVLFLLVCEIHQNWRIFTWFCLFGLSGTHP